MKKIALIGSTGSIGRQTVDVCLKYPDKFEIVALVANKSADLFLKQVKKIKPAYAALTDDDAAKIIGEMPQGVTLLSGAEAGITAIEECGADIAVVACGGFSGLQYSVKAAEAGLDIALANKESLVCGGEILLAKTKAQRIMPVDSEHSAIWQCLNFNLNARFEKLVITASGGAFRGRKWEKLKDVTPAQALKHPTWSMGAKITVDSATLLNKGYEVIEAHHLFNAPFGKIETVIHPQSVIHSMVQFKDGATVAQLSYPTMEIPIRLALTYPDRLEGSTKALDFNELGSLTFERLDRKAYPMYDLALTCGEAGGVLPTALNAASEVAVKEFLEGRLRYTDIFTVADKVVQSTQNKKADSLMGLFEVDVKSRVNALKAVKEV